MRRYLLFITACCLLGAPAYTQSTDKVEDVIADILDRLSEEDEEGTDLDAYYDALYARTQNPLNLNTASREDLEELVFLSDLQVENILHYLYRYGDMHSLYELRLVEGLGEDDIRRLLPFVRVESGERRPDKLYAREVWQYGKHNLYARFGGQMERARGYRPDDEGNRAYAGSPLAHYLKYQFHYKDRILVGLTAEKDAGEPWFRHGRGYDFFSGYAQINDIGPLKTLVAGDYRANFGEGLVVRTGFGMGRSSQALNLNRPKAGLRKSSSTEEYNFFRGAGATLRLGAFEFTSFYSYKKIDGDTADGTFPTLVHTGLHRTASERRKRHTVGQHVVGGDLTYTHTRLQVGITAAHTRLSHALQPTPTLYNATRFHGRQQTTGGLHYRLRLGKLNVSGETAVTHNGAAATVNGFHFMPVPQVGVVVQHRYLSPHYDTFHARVFGVSSSHTGNEHGVYIGTEAHPFRRWTFSAYADMRRHPWLRYGTASPSSGADYLLQAEFAPRDSLRMYWRIQYKAREVNFTHTLLPVEEVVPHDKWSFRYGLTREAGGFRLQTLLLGNLVREAGAAWTYGVSAAQDVSYSFARIPLRIDARFQFFDAQEYDNRIYVYERDVLHAFSIPMQYGTGSRYYLNFKYAPLPSLALWLKVAQTVYADRRETTGSGHDAVAGHRRTTVHALVQWKF